MASGGIGGSLSSATDVQFNNPASGEVLRRSSGLWVNSQLTVSDVSNLQTTLAAKAADTDVVKIAGVQTIAGVKTFSDAPVVPDGAFTPEKVSGLSAALLSISEKSISVLAKFPRQTGDIDDTERMQRAVDYCAANSIPFCAAGDPFYTGKYTLRQVNLKVGVNYDFGGALLWRPDLLEAPYSMTESAAKWVRMLNLSYSGTAIAAPTKISNVSIDGNAYNIFPGTPNYNMEQASLIMIGSSSGKLPVALQNISCVRSMSDGIHLFTNVDATITNLYTEDCFRGGLTVTGGNTTFSLTGWTSKSTVPEMTDGCDIEIDSSGFGGTKAIIGSIVNATLTRDLDINVPVDGQVSLKNVQATDWTLGTSGLLEVENCTLNLKTIVGGTGRRLTIFGAGMATFSNTIFNGRGDLSADDPALPVMFYNSPTGSIELYQCTFANATHGIGGGYSTGTDMIVRNCRFTSGLDIAIGAPSGVVAFGTKSLIVEGNEFANSGLWLQLGSSYVQTVAFIGQNNITNPSSMGLKTYNADIRYMNQPFFSYGAGHTVISGGKSGRTVGSRTVVVDIDPNDVSWGSGRLAGISGDIAVSRSVDPVTREPRRWAYAMYNGNPGYYRHFWEEQTTYALRRGTTGNRPVLPVDTNVPYFDTTLGKPVWVKAVGVREIDTLTITAGASAAGDVSITLNGTTANVAVLATDVTTDAVATKIRAATFTGWTTGGTGSTVTFTKNTVGTNTAPAVNPNATGVTGTFAVTTTGVTTVWVDATGATV